MKNTLIFPDHSEDIQKFEWGEVIWIHEPKQPNLERMSVGLVKLFPKSKHVRHFHFGEEQILYTLQGKGIHRINDEEKIISQGMILHCPPYTEHEVTNMEDVDLIIMIIYAPAKTMDFQSGIPAISNKHILDYVDIELLENIQKDLSNLLQLSVKITDANKCDITKFVGLNSFCGLCPHVGNCEEELTSVTKSPFSKIEDVCICNNNIITLWIPILVKNSIIGYIKCGHLLINRPDNIQEKLYLISQKHDISFKKLQSAYDNMPLVPKSRLYALEESLIATSRYITGIIENSIIQSELKEKNKEILEKIQHNIDLEDALNESNKKLLKYEMSSKLNVVNYQQDNINYIDDIEYPFEKEADLENCVRILDENKSIIIIKDIIKDYEDKNIPLTAIKCVFIELFTVISRILYKETHDAQSISKIRRKYKKVIDNAYDYTQLQIIAVEFINDCIKDLKQGLHKNDKGIINRVNLYIKENYYQDLNLKSIAEKFYISPNYLSKIFNEENQMSLSDYINRIRIEKAKEYLIKTNMKISMIGKKVGCSNISYFSYIFKKIEKCTPKEYRLKHRD
ncbi:PocR ligand-binding domain-containing protein [Paramaledivibacter caminithermalis]|uniref:Cupin domain-containing protein n=1 Tax=Paramaledivibacter caminithermalis (strain DSM 15212 / CIP 107654 / DViRD3) TaxID=1121301 RepID=A0A1M6NCD2_PARC5|nr:helix-turn-helix domain-containing protein [Paramaledivibacter caminithermalis]SHJ93380.1 Cupin domain-containing protein [Paramaledivibacter caminithermalis DSM 15212]